MNDWIATPLEQLADISSGGTPSRANEDFWGGDIPWVTPSDITKCKTNYLYDTQDFITNKGLLSSSAKLLPAGTLLFTSRATIGEIKISTKQISTNQGFKNLVPKDCIDTDFLFYQIIQYKNEFVKYAAGSTFLEINRKDTGRVLISHPSDKNEQQKISLVLNTIDRTIAKTEALIEKYQQIKAGLMHDLFTRGIGADGKLRSPREEAPELYQETAIGWIPKEWELGLLNEIVNPSRPIVYGILMPGYGYEGGVPVIKVKDIKNRKINIEDLLLTSPKIDNEYRRSKLRENDILLTIRGTVGRICIIPAELENANITQDTARIDIVNGVNEFYSYYFETEKAICHLSVNTLGVAVQGINLGEVRKMPVPKPKREEQKAIVKKLSCFSRRLDSETMMLQKLQKQKSGLMHDLLTGKVSVDVDPAP